MSDNHALDPPSPVGEIDHEKQLSLDIGQLFLSNEYSDVVINVNDTSFPAHKVVLASRSEYFRAMLYGGMRESSSGEVNLAEIDSVEAFKHLLQYIYTGHMDVCLSSMKEEMILEVLGLSHKYGFLDLEESISDYVRQALSIENVCLFYEAANLYSLQNLAKDCFTYIGKL